jgi:hypothetical protein
VPCKSTIQSKILSTKLALKWFFKACHAFKQLVKKQIALKYYAQFFLDFCLGQNSFDKLFVDFFSIFRGHKK